MQTLLATRHHGTAAIAQEGIDYFDVTGMGSVEIDTMAVASGTYKIYGAPDYHENMADKTAAHWVPIASVDTAGVKVAADGVVTPSTTKTVRAICAGYTGIRIVEQDSGTVSVQVTGSQIVPPDLLAATGATIAVTLGAGTNIIGSTPPVTRTVDVTFSCFAGACAAGDIIADSQAIANAVSANDEDGYLVGFQILDEDDQAAAQIDLILLSANVSIGTEGDPISVSDANARNILHAIPILSTEFVDLINSKIATRGVEDGPWTVRPASGTRIVYAALVARGTPTQTASGITARFYFQDTRRGS